MSTLTQNNQRWFVLLGLMLVYAATTGIAVHTLPLVYPSLIEDFGWTTAQMTLPATVFYIVGALCAPFGGVLLDRFPPRTIMYWGVSGIALSLFAFGFIQELWQLVAIFFGIGLSMALCGLTASMVVLTKWFEHDRGRATGLLLMSASIGGAVFPQVLALGIESVGWRSGLLVLAVIALALMIPSLMFLVKDRDLSSLTADQTKPETAGSSADSNTTVQAGLHMGPKLPEALKNPNFYLIAVATSCVWFSVIALLQHQSIHLSKDLGVDLALVPRIFSIFFICSFLGKIGFGWLSDYCKKEVSMMLSVIALIASFLMLKQAGADDVWLLNSYAVVAGIGFGGSFTTIQLLIAQHFAGHSYGKILALLVMIDSIAGAMGTRVIANMRDSSDNYLAAFDTMIAVCVIAMVSIVIILMLDFRKKA